MHRKKKNYQMQSRYYFGLWAERVAIIFLRLKGYQIMEWRWKNHFGEIDIIARKSNIIVAIEVKARRSEILIEQVLTPNQMNRIKNSLNFYISKNKKYQNYNLRLDFISFNKFLLPKHYCNIIG